MINLRRETDTANGPPALGNPASTFRSYVPESCHASRTKIGPQFFSFISASIIVWAPARSALVTANDVVVVVDEVNWRVVEAVEGRRGREEENEFTPLETMAATAREAQAIFMVKDTGGGAERAMVTKT